MIVFSGLLVMREYGYLTIYLSIYLSLAMLEVEWKASHVLGRRCNSELQHPSSQTHFVGVKVTLFL